MNDNSEIIKSKLIPNTIEAIEEYLVSIKSVGALTANRYVYKGGLKTLEILRINIGLPGKIKGVGPKKQLTIWKTL
ncbi:MAG: hypothetical protein ABSA04_10775 [Desulfobaccales bacterium]|jgi:hypothetical protein